MIWLEKCDIENVNSIVIMVSFVYLFIYKIGGYIFNYWYLIIKIATKKQPIYADRNGEPIYEGDSIAFKGRIYTVERCFHFGWNRLREALGFTNMA